MPGAGLELPPSTDYIVLLYTRLSWLQPFPGPRVEMAKTALVMLDRDLF